MNKDQIDKIAGQLQKSWQLLEWREADQLHLAMDELHQAAQYPAIVSHHLEPGSGLSGDLSLEWEEATGSLVSRSIRGPVPFRLGIRFSDLTLFIRPERETEGPEYRIRGKTRVEVLQWIRWKLTQLGYRADNLTFRLPYSVSRLVSQKYEAVEFNKKTHLKEIERYFSNLAAITNPFIDWDGMQFTTPVCRTRDFVFSCLVRQEETADYPVFGPFEAGLAPPMPHCPEPHLFVQCPLDTFQGDSVSGIPPLPEGARWITAGGPTAILPGSEISHLPGASLQAEKCTAFLLSVLKPGTD